MKHRFPFFLLLAALLIPVSCIKDQLDYDESLASRTDPDLLWSATTCEATIGATDNTFPSLTNKYGVSVSYASSDEDIATIDSDGEITLLAAGTTTITASSAQTSKYEAASVSYTLTVLRAAASLAWSSDNATVVIGSDEYDLPTLAYPDGVAITYSSSDTGIATIDEDGIVTIIADGSVVITATSEETDVYESESVSYTLTITKNTDGISWSKKKCTVTIDSDSNVFPTLNNPGGQTVTYASSHTSVATIDDAGSITLVKSGVTTITATSEETESYAGTSASYTLVVQSAGSDLASADLEWPETAYSATMGEDFSSPTLSNPHSLTVSYSSSDETVATIASDGTVTLLAAGTTIITADSEATSTYAAGSAFYTLTVSKAAAGLAWSESSCTATLASDDNTFPTLSNENGLTVSYSTSDEDVATIDESGVVTLVSAGTVSILASSAATDTYAAGTVSYTLKVVKHSLTLVWSESSFSASLADENDFPTLSIDPSGVGITPTYASSNTDAATIDSDGNITLLAIGTTTISATYAGDDTYKAASASYTLTVRSGADTGAGTYTYASTGDTSSSDDISTTTFTRKITVTYSTSGDASVEGDYYGYASVSGNQVTVTNTGSEYIVYELTGTTTNGFFKLYSSKKQAILLNGVSITNPSGAAINNQSGKRTFVMVEGSNILKDSFSAAYSADGDEDMKSVFFSEGQLVFSGGGSLTVTASNAQSKSCVVSDDYVRIMGSSSNSNVPTLTLTAGSSAGHGLRGKEYVQISNGALTISTAAAMKKGIGSDDYVLVEGGTTNITVTGGVAYDSDDAEYKGSAGIKADNYFKMTAGTVNITNSGNGGKGLRAGSYDYDETSHTLTDSELSGGTLTIKTTGSESNDVSAKGIKIGWATKSGETITGYAGNLIFSGATVNVTATGSEAIEAKGNLTVSGGVVYGYSSGDDGMNCCGDMTISGGYASAWATNTSTGSDGFDANGNFYVTGGVAYGVCTHGSPDVAFDANTEGGKKLYVQGGTLIAVGGLESGASITGTAYKASSWSTGTWYGLWNSSSSAVFAFKTPSSGNSLIVYSSGNAVTVKSSITYSSGTSVFGGYGYIPGTITSSASSGISLSSYSSSSSGPGGGSSGGGPGGGGSSGPGGGGGPGR